MRDIKESELILNPDGSIYHIKLRPEHLAETVLLVGDPKRVSRISRHFDKIDFKIHNREFVTHTGTLNNKRLTVLATGIGTDNIDIVMNELDAVASIDFKTRSPKKKPVALDIIRLGTSGALQADIPVDSFVASTHGIGFDGLLNFYDNSSKIIDHKLTESFVEHTNWGKHLPYPYIVKGSEKLMQQIGKELTQGMTATAPGFYAPQGRKLRLSPAYPELNSQIGSFSYHPYRIINFEMETSALYGLGKLLGHETLTVCCVIANRINKTFSKNYKAAVDRMIEFVLKKLTDSE